MRKQRSIANLRISRKELWVWLNGYGTDQKQISQLSLGDSSSLRRTTSLGQETVTIK